MERLEVFSARLASTWTNEIAAALLSAGSLAALVGVLVGANGQPILHWQWHDITLNTIVSILSTISRISALFVLSAAIGQTKWILFSRGPASLLDFEAIDVASRGFIGCAQILLRARRVVVVGALAFLAAIAFDPFAQQLVGIQSEVVYEPNRNTTMSVSTRYDAGKLTFLPKHMAPLESSLYVTMDTVDFGMQSAILSGLTQQKTIIDSQMPYQCSSGNCTWQAVPSLAICSVCNDITSSLRRSWQASTSPASATLTQGSAYFGMYAGNVTTYTIPGKVFLDNMDGYSQEGALLSLTAYGTGRSAETVTLQDVDTLLWASGFIRADPKTTNASWPDDFTVSATECGLRYCVKEYNVSVSGNKVTEISREITSARRDPDSWLPTNKSATVFADAGMLRNLSYIELHTLTHGKNGDLPRTDLMLGESFNVTQAAILSLNTYMNDSFIQADTAYFNSSEPAVAAIGGYYIYDDASSTPDYNPAVMQPLYENGDFETTFETLAAAMSNAMRAHRSANETATGELGQLITRYRINWPWISLPAVVVIASIIQLLATMRASKGSPIWKSSTLATLSRGYRTHDVLGDAATIRDFRVAAGKHEVDLFDKDGRHSGLTVDDSGMWELSTVAKPRVTATAVERDESDASLLTTDRSEFGMGHRTYSYGDHPDQLYHRGDRNSSR